MTVPTILAAGVNCVVLSAAVAADNRPVNKTRPVSLVLLSASAIAGLTAMGDATSVARTLAAEPRTVGVAATAPAAATPFVRPTPARQPVGPIRLDPVPFVATVSFARDGARSNPGAGRNGGGNGSSVGVVVDGAQGRDAVEGDFAKGMEMVRDRLRPGSGDLSIGVKSVVGGVVGVDVTRKWGSRNTLRVGVDVGIGMTDGEVDDPDAAIKGRRLAHVGGFVPMPDTRPLYDVILPRDRTSSPKATTAALASDSTPVSG